MNKINENILADIRRGIPVIVIDDKDRENEGDIVIAAEAANKDNISFCMRYARGLMCIPCCGKILDKLELPAMVTKSTDPNETPFTVSVDACKGTTTGMSVDDRLKTISVLCNDNSLPEDLNRPGHLFPLRPKDGLLKERRGHTESSIELVKLAGMKPVCVIVEIINDDGTMARYDDLVKFAKVNNFSIVSVKDIYAAVYEQ
jgi:3,4-dihydroxy 2-butanone 4-phosphate synthase/GTP cyclohydrolase II